MVIIRFLIVVALVAIACLLSIRGTQSLPEVITGLTMRAGGDLQTITRACVGLSIALAGTLLVLGKRGHMLAILCALAITFIGIADAAASFTSSATGVLLPACIEIAMGGTALFLLMRAKSAGTKRTNTQQSRPGLRIFGILSAIVLGAIVAANRIPPDTRAAAARRTTYTVVDFPLSDWPGQTLQETGLLEYLPALTALADLGGPSVLAFYTPHCNQCHEFFAEEFASHREVQIIAIKVPAAEGVEAADQTLSEDVDCKGCTMLTLPKGPVWLIQSPLIVAIVDGKVTCVTQHDEPESQRECIEQTEQLARAIDNSAATETPLEDAQPSPPR
jgi:hypothetical protein